MPPESIPDPVEELLALCLAEPPGASQQAAIERACESHPEWSNTLRDRFETLVDLGLNGIAAPSVDPDGEPSGTGVAYGLSTHFGDFDLLEVIGQGGMGIVHRAHQRSLDRDVVVKLIRPEFLFFDGSRERFVREADAIARLSHPGIVPVHAAGEHAGVPYFAMDFVEGRGLDECIQNLAGRAPNTCTGGDLSPGLQTLRYVDAVLTLGKQIAAALHHAHQRGILHRDVKPSNILLSEEGRTCLIDFGLHALHDGEPSSEEGERLTRAGSAPGTLLYMAPEQLEEGIYDVRSEVYALGATLYELLTHEPPFRGENRTQTERLIRAGNPRPLHELNPAVNGDTRAVIQKALATDPTRRYVDMRAFEDDLQRLLEHRPVAARPDSWSYRARRWVRRQPALATAIGALALFVVAGPAAWIIKQQRHNADLQQALQRETDARLGAEDLSKYVIDVLESADPNLNKPNAAAQRILERGVERLDARLADRPLRQAEVRRILGRIHGNLGLWEQGAELLRRSLATFETQYAALVDEEAPSGEQHLALDQVIETRSALAWLLENRNQLAASLEHRIQLEKEIAAIQSANAWQVLHARANWMRLARLVPGGMPHGEPAPTKEQYQRVLREAVESMDVAKQHTPEYYAAALGWLGTHLVQEAQSLQGPERKSKFEEARGYLLHCIQSNQEINQGDTLDCAKAWLALGLAHKSLGDLDPAENAYNQALQTFQERLAPDHYLLAGAMINLAGLLEARGRPLEAIPHLERAERIMIDSVGADDPNAVVASGNLIGTRFRAGQIDGLLPLIEELIPRQIAVFGEQHPFVAASFENLGLLRVNAGNEQDAIQDLEHAAQLFAACYGPGHKKVTDLGKMLNTLRERQ